MAFFSIQAIRSSAVTEYDFTITTTWFSDVFQKKFGPSFFSRTISFFFRTISILISDDLYFNFRCLQKGNSIFHWIKSILFQKFSFPFTMLSLSSNLTFSYRPELLYAIEKMSFFRL